MASVVIPPLTEQTREIADKLLRDDTDPLHRRFALSRAITLLESTAPAQTAAGEGLLAHLLSQRNGQKSNASKGGSQPRYLRIGIAGPPGAGKSTMIEALGKFLLDPPPSALAPSCNHHRRANKSEKHDTTATTITSSSSPSSTTMTTTPSTTTQVWFPQRLAVLCIDPSSHRTGGSILGDKTRMTALSVHPRAFVRPTPSAGHLGGLAAATDQVVRLYSAAGYDLTLVETVGLGQSEVEVAESVDLTVLLVPPAAGDGLQGMKRGILEIADLVVVTKADGDLRAAAQRTAADYQGSLQFLTHPGSGPPPAVLLASSQTGQGLSDIWQHVLQLYQQRHESGQLTKRRREQRHYWMWKSLQMLVEMQTRRDPQLAATAVELKQELDQGNLSPRLAAAELLRVLSNHHRSL